MFALFLFAFSGLLKILQVFCLNVFQACVLRRFLCIQMSLCICYAFLTFFSCVCLFCSIPVCLFLIYITSFFLGVCFLVRERKNVDFGGLEGGDDLREVGKEKLKSEYTA